MSKARQPFTIDCKDKDLQVFELNIVEHHPELKQLKIGGKLSYEHPQFHELSIKVSDMPGNSKPYCIFAMNLFGLDDIEEYYWECQKLLERPISQLVKNDSLELSVRAEMHRIMHTIEFRHPYNNEVTLMARELVELVEHCCYAWDNWLFTVLKAQIGNEEAMFTPELLTEIIDKCSYVADQLVLLSKLPVMNTGAFEEFRPNQKYALLAKSLLQLYQDTIVSHVQCLVDDLQSELLTTMGYEKLLRIDTKRYVDMVLYYELSKRAAELEMEHTGIKYEREVELKSPNAFIYTRLHGGYKASDIRATYRWLFIKAWLYSWLKVNAVSANKAAEEMAKNDRFFYLDKVSRKVGKDGVVESDDECYARRQKQLNSEFSKWKKYDGPFSYISDSLFSKSRNAYEKSQQSK
ncbi:MULTISPECIES: hypothetical protein [Vibrio]|uniref:hypothetical protein n=1 Tax=Vibrio TaxID=662 RepID=UPI00029A357B|nr:hypothetical protein [Vibrio cyclitrophicus]OEE26306.1 hypothetical protein OAM_12275 [Vibrio cyclitrophicus ZF14]